MARLQAMFVPQGDKPTPRAPGAPVPGVGGPPAAGGGSAVPKPPQLPGTLECHVALS